MNEKIQFYYNPMSRGRIVHWMLEEVGAPYEIKLLDWTKREHKSPEYLKINPMGKVPAIIHKSVVITETPAICAYLAEAFPKAGLSPAIGDPERGSFLRWMFFTVGCVDPALMDRKFPRTTNLDAGHLGYGTYEDTFRTLENAISNGYVVGNKFSAVDVYIASCLGWYIQMKDIEPKPVYTKYLELCSNRPGFKRFTEQVAKLT